MSPCNSANRCQSNVPLSSLGLIVAVKAQACFAVHRLIGPFATDISRRTSVVKADANVWGPSSATIFIQSSPGLRGEAFMTPFSHQAVNFPKGYRSDRKSLSHRRDGSSIARSAMRCLPLRTIARCPKVIGSAIVASMKILIAVSPRANLPGSITTVAFAS